MIYWLFTAWSANISHCMATSDECTISELRHITEERSQRAGEPRTEGMNISL